ncbi:MAG TPA: hypothetical protein VKT77_10110 [Chthonomonadaceae bacterium]|nr:hypothetical protein [Chthonomonadaceae bacterium]
MDQELERVAALVRDARDPEDVLGVEPILLPRGAQLENRKRAYLALKAVTSLEYQSPEDVEAARDIDRRLEAVYAEARERIEMGVYNLQGRGAAVPQAFLAQSFDAGGKRYYVGPRFRQGEHSTLYTGYVEIRGEVLGEVMLKVAASAEDSGFVEREADVLGILRKDDYRETSYAPWPLGRFESAGRMGLILRRVDGFTLQEVRQHAPYVGGLDPRDMVWMLSRTLAVMGMAHGYGVIHGRIAPQHVLVEPPTHRALVIGWGGAAIAPARTGQTVREPIDLFSAPEAASATAGPWSDIYSIGKTFLWLLDGDPATDTIPAHVEPRLATLLRTMVADDPYQRPDDCWQLFESLERMKTELWGERKWRALDLPGARP